MHVPRFRVTGELRPGRKASSQSKAVNMGASTGVRRGGGLSGHLEVGGGGGGDLSVEFRALGPGFFWGLFGLRIDRIWARASRLKASEPPVSLWRPSIGDSAQIMSYHMSGIHDRHKKEHSEAAPAIVKALRPGPNPCNFWC